MLFSGANLYRECGTAQVFFNELGSNYITKLSYTNSNFMCEPKKKNDRERIIICNQLIRWLVHTDTVVRLVSDFL